MEGRDHPGPNRRSHPLTDTQGIDHGDLPDVREAGQGGGTTRRSGQENESERSGQSASSRSGQSGKSQPGEQGVSSRISRGDRGESSGLDEETSL